jgi:hypothetical protein
MLRQAGREPPNDVTESDTALGCTIPEGTTLR